MKKVDKKEFDKETTDLKLIKKYLEMLLCDVNVKLKYYEKIKKEDL